MSTQVQQYSVEVEGVGVFSFARRNMRREMAIQAEYSRLTEGVATPTPALDILAGVISTLKALTLSAPAGWNIDEMDALDDEVYGRLMRVHAALRAKEDSFRRGNEAGGQGARPGDGGQHAVPVPAAVQPATN